MSGLLGKKIGMTQVFTDDGLQVAVTVIEAGPCSVLSVGEKSIRVGFDTAKPKSLKKPQLGIFEKLKIAPKKFIHEIAKDKEYKVGEELKVDFFKNGDYVDIVGVSKGKGFQGGMKRWHWSGGPATHGSTSHRRVGSIGSTTTPGRTLKGHHMPGHMGNRQLTIQNLRVIKVDVENNLLLVKGPVPGSKNNYLIIKKSIKRISNV